MDLLNMKDITVHYGKEQEASVKNFNLTLQPGEIIALVGESGSGKTTILRSILGLLPGKGNVEQGDIFFQGTSLLSLDPKQWKDLRGTEISMIFQDSGAMINPIRTIGDQFVEYIRTHKKVGKKEAWKKGADMLAKMHLHDAERVMKSYPFQLSGGMRQRVGIAMAMTFQPKILLADEPTSALDVTTQAQIVRQFMEIRDLYHTAIIMVTHNIAMAAYMADQLIVMRNGRITESGKKEDVIKNPKSEYTKICWRVYRILEGKDMSDQVILTAEHITKKFSESKGQFLTACDDINLNVYKGKTLGIVGESGCGKSTFVKLMVNVLEPTEGSILYHGEDITKLKGENCCDCIKRSDAFCGSRDSFLSQNESNGYCDRTPYELPTDPEIGKRRKGKRTAPYGGTSGRVYLSIPAQYERRSKAKGRNCTGIGVRTRDHCM